MIIAAHLVRILVPLSWNHTFAPLVTSFCCLKDVFFSGGWSRMTCGQKEKRSSRYRHATILRCFQTRDMSTTRSSNEWMMKMMVHVSFVYACKSNELTLPSMFLYPTFQHLVSLVSRSTPKSLPNFVSKDPGPPKDWKWIKHLQVIQAVSFLFP